MQNITETRMEGKAVPSLEALIIKEASRCLLPMWSERS
jgi:hypothetical protein